MDRGAQRAAVYGTAKSRTRLKWLSTRTKARELQEHDQMDPLRALSTIGIRWREMTKTGRKERCLQSLFLVSLVLLVWTVQQKRGDEIRGIVVGKEERNFIQKDFQCGLVYTFYQQTIRTKKRV